MRSERLRVRPGLRPRADEPLVLLVNVFDCAVVLALGLAVLVGKAAPSAADAAVPEHRTQVERWREAPGRSQGEGMRLGVAYRLQNGEVVFVPEGTPDLGR